MRVNNRRSITEKFINSLKNRLVGKMVTIVLDKSQWIIKDISILEM
ncbi:MAG: hypothetical protein PHW82_10845 [Bacteroidales bacterium]|nr:hypothetical protein [Bacteroidales bacterium]